MISSSSWLFNLLPPMKMHLRGTLALNNAQLSPRRPLNLQLSNAADPLRVLWFHGLSRPTSEKPDEITSNAKTKSR